jgi:hypothetical protein
MYKFVCINVVNDLTMSNNILFIGESVFANL